MRGANLSFFDVEELQGFPNMEVFLGGDGGVQCRLQVMTYPFRVVHLVRLQLLDCHSDHPAGRSSPCSSISRRSGAISLKFGPRRIVCVFASQSI